MTFIKLFTLALIRNGDQVLLGMKKTGFGVGKWNGFGGKVEVGESIHAAAVRELEEESGLLVEKFQQVGILKFEFAGDPMILEVHVYTTDKYSGKLMESNEMSPKWFSVQEIPYKKMWPDDELWFPMFLKGQKFQGYFFYENQETIGHYSLSAVDEFSDKL